MSLPKSWVEELRATPGSLLVIRAEMPALSHAGIWIPDTTRDATICQEADVIASAAEGFEVGDCILLAPNAGEMLSFGMVDEVIVYKIFPAAVLAKVIEPGAGVTVGDRPAGEYKSPFSDHHRRLAYEEGDPLGKR